MAIKSFRAGEAVTAGDVLFMESSGFAFKGSALERTNATAVGVALDSVASGNLVRVDTDGVYTVSPANLEVASLYYLATTPSGSFQLYDPLISGMIDNNISGVYLSVVGRAVSTSQISIEFSQPVYQTNPSGV